jgi:hypothetical protein
MVAKGCREGETVPRMSWTFANTVDSFVKRHLAILFTNLSKGQA